jgi:predicted extracellular nuclease
MFKHILSIITLTAILTNCGTTDGTHTMDELEKDFEKAVGNTDSEKELNTTLATSPYNIGFYNVENLFDTKDDPSTEDEWFLPTSETQWDDKKYQKKLKDLASVIDAINSAEGGPDLIGLCEVENKQVVAELAGQHSLKANHYEVVHYESPDTRGIDVAAMYNPEKFELMESRRIQVDMPEDPAVKTRDILFCKFTVMDSQDIIYFYVNHWSSRRKGENETFYKRKNCAMTLLNDMETNIPNWQDEKIIIVGDMNDYPDNKSIYDVLGAKEMDSNSKLTNMQYANHKKGQGTYNYKGEWGCLDNVIISDALIDNLTDQDATIFDKDWIMYFNKSGEPSPNKTYGGSKYYGGYSDHLPVYFEINL